MPDVVKVSTVETIRNLMVTIEEYFKVERYAEITQAIGMYSLLIDSEHTISDQNSLYRSVLNMIKNRLSDKLGKTYSQWYADFPKILATLVVDKRPVVDETAAEVLASHHAAYGPFKSLDDFFFWCLDDRRLTLAQIVKYIEITTDTAGR
jgi:hypothetical protein